MAETAVQVPIEDPVEGGEESIISKSEEQFEDAWENDVDESDDEEVDAEEDQNAAVDNGDVPDDESALHHNIRSKGRNSYYYAHGRKPTGPVWDKNPTPRLLVKQPCEAREVLPDPITQYAWLDENGKVKIYITLPAIGEHPDDNIKLEWTTESLSLRVVGFGGKDLLLLIPILYDKIERASLRKKTDKIVVIMKKQNDFTWNGLKKSTT